LIFGATFSWWIAAAYLGLVIGCFYLPVLIMYHDVAHRRLFRPQYAFLKHYLNWVLGPFFGMFPNGFYAHHVAMHHLENNLRRDMSSTMLYQRDSPADFLRYALHFPFSVHCKLALYLWQRKRYRLLRAVVIGEVAYLAVVATTAYLNWQAALVVFILPLVAAMVGFSCTNWSEHAFVDRASPHNIYRSAIICVNTAYNHIGFNDGYHIGHHLKPNLHWSEMPEEFLDHRETYAREGAIVFEGLNYYRIWFLLMTKQYRVLARHSIDLAGRRHSEDETIEMLRQRTTKFDA
jgi:fatty acid desaturase